MTLAWLPGTGPHQFHPTRPAATTRHFKRHNRTVRSDWLAHHLFETLDEVPEFATNGLWTYNHDRPNLALGGITPKQRFNA